MKKGEQMAEEETPTIKLDGKVPLSLDRERKKLEEMHLASRKSRERIIHNKVPEQPTILSRRTKKLGSRSRSAPSTDAEQGRQE